MEPEPRGAVSITLIRNVSAGARVGGREQLARALARAGVPAEVRSVPPDQLAQEITLRSREAVVAVCGGDGSLATAADILAGSATALAPFPGGTLNHFVRRLGIANHDVAARALAAGARRSVPLGFVDDTAFLNTSTFGFYADVVRRRERLRRWLGRWPSAIVGFAESFARMPRYEVTLVVEGRELRRSTPLIWVGVGWGTFPRVVLDPLRDSLPALEIVILRPRSRAGMLGLLRRLTAYLLRGRRPADDPGLEILHARSALIDGGDRIPATLDGEVVDLRPPILVSLVDHALDVVVPPGQSESGRGAGRGSQASAADVSPVAPGAPPPGATDTPPPNTDS